MGLKSIIIFIASVSFVSSATLTLTPIIQAGISGTNTCEAKCTSCADNTNKDCLTCEFGHFLLLSGGKVRCAQCPDYTNWVDIPPSLQLFEAGDKNCLDCYANPSSWQYTRQCTRKLKAFNIGVPSFVIFSLNQPELYQIKDPSGPGEPYTTEKITGCEIQQNSQFQIYEQLQLYRYSNGEVNALLSIEDTTASKIKVVGELAYTCPAETYFSGMATNIATKSEQTIVTYANCIKCLSGFVLKESDYSCVQCPDNCDSCDLVGSEQTVCNKCSAGYFPDLGYTCQLCNSFTGLAFCTQCYLRKPSSNKQIDQDLLSRIFSDASDSYKKWPTYTQITTAAQAILNEAITSYVMSCKSCSDGYSDKITGASSKITNSIQFQYIVAIDHLSCVSCATLSKCAKCDYFHQTNFKRRKVTRAYEGTEDDVYGLFCLECIYSSTEARVLSLKEATGCISGTVITDCAVHFGRYPATGAATYSTMPVLTSANADKISITTDTLVIACQQCKDDQKLNADESSCGAPGAISNCARYKDTDCVACVNDRILNMEQKALADACTSIMGQCTQKLQNCMRCYGFKPDAGQENYLFRCIECVRGYIPTLEGCIPCGIIGCDVCEELGELHSFTNYLKYSLPTSTEFAMQKLQAQHSVTKNNNFCRKPETNPQGNQVPGYSDYLNGKRYNCISDRCNCDTSTKSVHCRMCAENEFNAFGDQFIQSINESGIQCVDCPAYCYSCAQRTDVERKSINPFFGPDSESLKPYQRVCNVCDRKKMPVNQIVSWDSTFGRCIKCDDSTNQSDNSKLCQKRVQFWYILSCENTPTNPTLNEKNYYALWETFPDSGQGVFTFANDDFDLDKFQTYNQEMYTYFQFYLYFQTSGSSTVCSLTDDFKIDSGISRSVFAVRDLQLIINTIDIAHLSASTPTYYTGENLHAGSWSDTLKNSIGKHPVELKLSGQFNIDYFNYVEINNVKVTYATGMEGKVFGLQIRNPLLRANVVLNNITVGDSAATTKSTKYFMVNITNPSVLVIANVTIASSTYQSKQTPFNYIIDENLESEQFTLNITNLVLRNLYISSATMLESPFLKSTINVFSLSLYTSEFNNAQLFSDRYANVTDKIPRANLAISNILISEVQFTDSRLIYFRAVLTLVAKSWTISQKSEFKSSSKTVIPIISSNSLDIWDVTVQKGIVFYRTTLMANVRDSPATLDENTRSFKMDQFRIEQILCLETSSCILNLATPTVGSTVRSQVHIHDLEIQKVNLELFAYTQPTGLTVCQKNLTEVAYDLDDLKSSSIQNPILSTYDYIDVDHFRKLNAQTGLIYVEDMEEMLFTDLSLQSNVEVYGLTVKNVETLGIHKASCIFDDQTSEQKHVNVTLAKQCFSALYLYDIDKVKFSKTCFRFYEIQYNLNLRNVNITTQLIQNAPLMLIEISNFYTYQPFYSICGLKLNQNIIFVSAKESSSAGLMIQSLISIDISFNDLELKDSEMITFQDIIGIVPSSTGILLDTILGSTNVNGLLAYNLTSLRNNNAFWIQSQKVILSNITCNKMNFVVKDLPLFDLSNQGGCGYIGVESKLQISGSKFIDSYSSAAGALYISLIGQVSARITLSQFEYCKTTLLREVLSFGGAILIDLKQSISSVFTIDKSSFVHNSARLGGSIYVNGFSTSFTLMVDQIKGLDMNAVAGGFLYGSFESKHTNQVHIINSRMQEDHDTSFDFLKNFTKLKDDDTFTVMSDNSLIYLTSASLTTKNMTFTNIFYERVIYVKLGSWRDFNSTLKDIWYFNNPIITCYQSLVSVRNLTVTGVNLILDSTISHAICENIQVEDVFESPRCLFHQYIVETTKMIDFTVGDNAISLTNSNFTNIKCHQCSEGTVYIEINEIKSVLSTNNFPITIQNNHFSNNTAHKAAGIYIYKKVKSASSQVVTADAEAAAAARVLQESSSNSKTLIYPNVAQYLVIGNSFVNNTAEDMAGAFYSVNQELTLTQNNIKNNTAKNNAGGVIIQNTYVEMKLNEISGNNAKAVAGVRLISFQPKYQYQSNSKLYLTELDLDTAEALQNLTLKMGNTFSNNTAEFGSGNVITGCVIGEFYQNRQCEKCNDGTYSIDQDDQEPQCLKCPSGAICKGSYIIIVQQGYWRPNYFTDLVEQCKNMRPNCIGQNSTNFTQNSDLQLVKIGNQLCFQGYVGALCETCDIEQEHWNDNYASAGNFACALCSELSGPNSAIIILISALTLGFIVFSVNSTLKANTERLKIRSQVFEISFFRYIAQKFFKTDNGALFIKIFTNYTQIISVIATFDLSIPAGVNDTTEAAGTPIKKLIFSLDCFLVGIQGELPIQYMRLLWSFVVPVIYMGLLLASFFFYVFIKRQKPDYNVIVCGILFLYIYYQPNLSLQFIGVLSCRKVSGLNYIQAQMNKLCYTPEHNAWLGGLIVPTLLILIFVIPLFIFIRLTKSKAKLTTTNMRMRYGILYNEYTLTAYYWELLKIIQKTMIILFVNFFNNDDTSQGTSIFLILMGYAYMAQTHRPYLLTALNQLDLLSTYVCAISMIMAILASANSSAKQPTEFSWMFYIGVVVIAFINIYFIVTMIVEIFKSQLEKMGGKALPLKKKLVKIACFQNCIHVSEKADPQRIEALWLMFAMIRREWSKLRQTNQNCQFYEGAQNVKYDDVKAEVHQRREEKKKKEEEEKKKQDKQNPIEKPENEEEKNLQEKQSPILEENQQNKEGEFKVTNENKDNDQISVGSANADPAAKKGLKLSQVHPQVETPKDKSPRSGDKLIRNDLKRSQQTPIMDQLEKDMDFINEKEEFDQQK